MNETLGYAVACKSESAGMVQYGRADEEEPGVGVYATLEEAKNLVVSMFEGSENFYDDQENYIIELRIVKKLE